MLVVAGSTRVDPLTCSRPVEGRSWSTADAARQHGVRAVVGEHVHQRPKHRRRLPQQPPQPSRNRFIRWRSVQERAAFLPRWATVADKSGKRGCCAPFRGGAGSPSNTVSRGPRSTSVPSGILMHPAVWPQYTWAEKWGLLCPFEGELGPHLTHCHLGRGLPPYQVVS